MSGKHSEEVIYCPTCGHSASHLGLLAITSDKECSADIVILPLQEWKRLAPKLNLTRKGREALKAAQ